MSPETAAPVKPKTEADRIESMLEALSPGDKIIVYRVVVNPTTGKESRPVKAVLTEFQGIDDLDSWIFGMAAEQHWPAGEYLLDHRKAGVNGVHCRKSLSVEPPPAPETPGAVLSPLEVVRQAKELLGSTQQASPDKVLESVTAAMRVGQEAAKGNAPPPDGTAALLKPVLEAIAKKFSEEPKAPADPFALLKELKALGLFSQTVAPEKAKTLAEQIGELQQLGDALAGLAGPAGPALEPTAVAVAKIFAPYVPQVLATINNVVDVVRLRFGMTGPLPTQPGGGPGAPRAVGPPPIPPAVQVLIARTQAAIAADDDTFFPGFAEGIITHILDGRGFLLQIQSGAIEEEQALLAVQGTGLLNAAEPRTRAWLIRFVHWLRAEKPLDATSAALAPGAPAETAQKVGAIRARCVACAQEYRFDTVEEFEQDTRICDVVLEGGAFCKGNIVLAPEGESA